MPWILALRGKLPEQLKNLIDCLGIDELHEINHYVMERINLIHNRDVADKMLQFRPGDSVFFHHNGRHIAGVVTRLNQKTMTVLVDGAHEWRVSPKLVSKFIEIDK
jgi:hypothetical protein